MGSVPNSGLKRKPRVFICYTNIDGHGKGFAVELKKKLEEAGYDVFFFEHSGRNHLGRPLFDVLTEQIDKIDSVIVVCTEAISASYVADYEYNHALYREKLVVAIKYDEAMVPSTIASKIRDSFDDKTSVGKFESLAKSLPTIYEEHLEVQKRRQDIKAKFEPKVELKPVLPSSSGARLLRSIVRAYSESTVVQDISSVANYDRALHGDLTFIQIGIRVAIPKEDMEKTDRVILVDELGRSVSTGERNYIFDVWSKKLPTREYSPDHFTAEEFKQILEELSARINPTLLFVPVEKYVEIASWMHRGMGGIRWEPRGAYFALEDGRALRIIWSNKYAPLDRLLLVDPSATRWLVKPDEHTGERVTAMFVENAKDPKKVDFCVRTLVNAILVNVEGVKSFRFD
jgi:hypothetical protein